MVLLSASCLLWNGKLLGLASEDGRTVCLFSSHMFVI